jgi:hypothetical protein
MAQYKVLRRHDGDKPYHAGDLREIAEAEAKTLVDLGVLVKVKEAAPVQNKADSVPRNKRGSSKPTI